MLRRVVCFGLLLTVVDLASGGSRVRAIPPLTSLIPFRRVEADRNKSYDLTEAQGPWMILATSFAGPEAQRQAQELVLELRAHYGLPAYMHAQSYDFTQPVVGKGFNQDGGPKIMKHRQAVKFKEIAVLVGNYESVDDPAMAKHLTKIKYAMPDCLDLAKNQKSNQRFAGLRYFHRAINGDEAKRRKGPMGSAFVTRNPILPKEYFVSDGIDEFVVGMNRGVKYSLLQNPGEYSVRVATFRGDTRLELDRAGMKKDRGPSSKLAEAAEKAHRLTLALREQGVPAYEFHDRNESIVTVGSFESVGEPRKDGKIEINEEIHRIMQVYAAQRRSLPGEKAAGLSPRRLNGITFDIQPIPVKVPRRSLGAEYAQRLGL